MKRQMISVLFCVLASTLMVGQTKPVQPIQTVVSGNFQIPANLPPDYSPGGPGYFEVIRNYLPIGSTSGPTCAGASENYSVYAIPVHLLLRAGTLLTG
jgi:hypothetical protein